MPTRLERSPGDLSARLRASGRRRAWLATDPATGELRSSLQAHEIATFLRDRARDYQAHEAIFLEAGAETGALLGVFVHQTRRGQAQGGLRHWRYTTLETFVRDGLRLSLAMGRKCALAGLWWGGGKGVIARPETADARDAGYRRAVYADFGRFVSSLRGCYVTAEDVGTTPADMAEVSRHTRFATCIPEEVGGSGNPSAMTAEGVVVAMEAALRFCDLGDLAGKRIAMQGGGNVGAFMIERLLARQVARIDVAEISEQQRTLLLDRFGGEPVEVAFVERGDRAFLATPCDILAPNALGGVLDPKTIPSLQARIVCGAANNPLADDERDARLLAERGITYVPDFVANRMGIVACSNEQYGSLPNDPDIQRHLDPDSGDSIQQAVARILDRAEREGTTPVAAANALADERSAELHPIWGHRAQLVIEALVRGDWEQPRPG